MPTEEELNEFNTLMKILQERCPKALEWYRIHTINNYLSSEIFKLRIKEHDKEIIDNMIAKSIKLFDICECENCNECSDKAYNKSMCQSEGTLTYAYIISKLQQLGE